MSLNKTDFPGGGGVLPYKGLKADAHKGFCSRSMLHSHFARVSTHEGAFSSSLNLPRKPRKLAAKYLTG